MGWFSDLFQRKKQQASFGAPLQYTCDICGKRLHGGTGRSLSASGKRAITAVSKHMSLKARQCRTCSTVFCLDYMLAAAVKKKQASIWHCPECDAEVSE